MRVAGAIAARYGLPASEIARHMSAGRFRVKSGVDRETAERLVADLEALGAMCMVVDEAGNVLPRRRPTAPEPAPRTEQPVKMETGLSAALHDSSQQDLGALGAASAPLSLATLDGEEEKPREQKQAVHAFSASDFAPPEAEEQELVLAVAVEKRSPPPQSMAPPVTAASIADSPPVEDEAIVSSPPPREAYGEPPLTGGYGVAPAPAGKPARPRRPKTPGENPLIRMRGMIADSPLIRLGVGVVAALLIGFLPAHLFASARESSAFSEIDSETKAHQSQVTDVDEWNALDEYRKHQLDRKDSKRTSIALSAVFVWAALSGVLAFLWFRKIDWDEYQSSA